MTDIVPVGPVKTPRRPDRGARVENLWTFGANPVENLTAQIFLCADHA
jgi:hypothetical protein